MPDRTLAEEIAEWMSSRPAWQQYVVQRLLEGEHLTQADYAGIATKLCANASFPLNGSAVTLPAKTSSGRVVLRGLTPITGINALVRNQTLTFAPEGLTVIYGDNGSGKSGYARLAKAVVRARIHEEVLTDVFVEASGAPRRARVDYQVHTSELTADWPKESPTELNAVTFYDRQCGTAYITTESETTFRPPELALLDGLVVACMGVKAELDARLQANSRVRVALPAVSESTAVGQFLSKLSSKTKPADVERACSVPKDAASTIAKLRQRESRLRASDVTEERRRLLQRADRLRTVASQIDVTSQGTSSAQEDGLRRAIRHVSELRIAAESVSAASFSSEPLPGVGTTAWKALWEAARRYADDVAGTGGHFPQSASHCPLCMQKLTRDGSKRLMRFEAFVSADVSRQVVEAEGAVRALRNSLTRLTTTSPSIAETLALLEADEPDVVADVRVLLAKLEERRSSLAALTDEASDVVAVPDGMQLDERLESSARSTEAKSEELTESQVSDELKAVVAQLAELEALTLANGQRDSILSEVRRLAERTTIEAARSSTTTTGVTSKATELTRQHVTALIRDRFTRETEQLNLRRVELRDVGGRRGQLFHQPSLLAAVQKAEVRQVLSEGEQTALGLAGLLTELAFEPSQSAIVLDDPVTSLDHVRREHVARRLAEIARERQVIVFTHDLAFISDIQNAAESVGVTVTERGIERRGENTPGIPVDHHPWKAKAVTSRLEALNQELQEIKQQRPVWNQEEYEDHVARWAGRLSEAWERIIRVGIADSVVDTGTQHVKPLMTKLLARFTDADHREYQDSYGRCSLWLTRHDKSDSVNYVAPEPSELEAELARVRAWWSRVRGYRS